jgi:DNA integrity scanning protein DisA with diadenylate cyclase activity
MDSSASFDAQRPLHGWRAFVAGLNVRSVGLTLAFGVLMTLLLSTFFSTPFAVLLGRMLFVSMLLLLAFIAAGCWAPPALTRWVPRWLLQILAVALAAPAASGLGYVLTVRGNVWAFFANESMLSGFIITTIGGLIVGLLLALGALVREREALVASQRLQFQLERSRLEHQAVDARLKLLTQQIEPHFLFNTLANVQALVEQGSARAAPVLASLIRYLRAAMPKVDGATPILADEIQRVRAYLDLMAMRMPDRLRFEISVDDGLGNLHFPPMALLTLVENAVRHGIDPSESGGTIRVRAGHAPDKGEARIVVEDDGAGLNDSCPPGTGLRNLRERLAAVYGNGARLELSECAPHGVRAEIVLPAQVAN